MALLFFYLSETRNEQDARAFFDKAMTVLKYAP